MKLNLHVPFKAWNGEEIKERKGEEEKAKMIDETVSLLLFSGDFIRRRMPRWSRNRSLPPMNCIARYPRQKA